MRRLRRAPLIPVAVILLLAIGVGAVATAFSVVHGVLSPLDFPRPAELVRLYATAGELRSSPNPRLAAIWDRLPVSYLNTLDWRQRSRTLHGIGLYEGYRAVLAPGGEPLEVAAARIDPELLRVLAVAPRLGRPFAAAEALRRERLVLLGHDLWVRVFAADRGILGRALRLDGQAYTVVGVMPAGFALPGRDDALWTLAGPTDDDLAQRDQNSYTAIARLAPGATPGAAQGEMDHLAADLARVHPETNTGAGVRCVPLLETVVGDSRRALRLLAAAGAAVLLIATVNLTLLLLAQGVDRQGERALRLALGARRGHLLRQDGVEALLLALAGSAGGLLLAALAGRALPRLLVDELPRLERVGLDGRVTLFAFATGLAATLASGVLPALLAFSGRGAGAGGGRPVQAMAERRSVRRWQEGLVMAEIALTLMLTTGALALMASWLRLTSRDPGFDPRGVLVQEIRLPAWQYPDEARRGELAARLLASLRGLPGVNGAALTSRLPIPGPAEVWGFHLAGPEPVGRAWTAGRSATMQTVTADYFRLLRIPLLAGRVFDERPGAEPARVVMVDRALAEHHWPGRSPVGGVMTMRKQEYKVAGVFGDFRQQGLAEEPGELMAQPWSQGPPAAFAALVRVAGDPLSAAPAARRQLRALDPALPLPPAARLEDVVARSLVGPRARTVLVGLSAGVALLLSLIGTYGVMAFNVGRRRREIAIRMTAGAGRGEILGWVLRRTLALAGGGIALGVLGTLAAHRLLSGLLYGVVAADPLELAATALLLIVASLAAGYGPARRASRIDPATTLHSL